MAACAAGGCGDSSNDTYELPTFELYEEGSQIRRPSKSVVSNIVEGYGRRRYKADYIRFLTYALASCDETREHLELLRDCGSLKNPALSGELESLSDELGRKLNRFIQGVESKHNQTPNGEIQG
jgi:four helix bundle protein